MTSWALQALNTSGSAAFMQLCQWWVRKLLLDASSLTTLSTHMHTIPRSPTLQYLPLRHLEVVVSSEEEWLQGFFDDVSRCCTLESLRIVYDGALKYQYFVVEAMELPGMQLHSMPSLKRVRLDNCFSRHELALPAEASLFLDSLRICYLRWQELCWGKFQHHTTILRLDFTKDEQWPLRIQEFSNLQYLELNTEQVCDEDLADLRHVPHVRIIMEYWGNLRLTAGSWKTLELLAFGKLYVSINDMDSFVRDTRDFTFMSQSLHEPWDMQLIQVQDTCLRQGRACHVRRHYDKCRGKFGATHGDRASYVTLSTSKEMAEDFPVICNDDKGPKVSFNKTLANWEKFWPCDPCDSLRTLGPIL